MDREYTALDVTRILKAMWPEDCSRLQTGWLYNLRKTHYFQPTGSTFFKKRQCYTFADLAVIAFIRHMRARGIYRSNFLEVIPRAQASLTRELPLRQEAWISDGEDLVLFDLRRPVHSLIHKPADTCWQYPIGMRVEEIKDYALRLRLYP